MSRRLSAVIAVAGLLLLGGCATQPAALTGSTVPAAPDGPALVDVAIGASETVGAGIDDGSRLRSAWPQVLYTTALPRGAVFYNFGIPGATVAEALSAELPQALAVRPDLVTVWLNVNDLLVGVPTATYESRLDQLVHALRRGGHTRVLVANTPWLDKLDSYLACLPDAPLTAAPCGLPGGSVPPPDQMDAQVDAYNAAIARVVSREGADLVDLHAAGEVPLLHPEYISRDGFHPSEKGHVAVAQLFAEVLRRGR